MFHDNLLLTQSSSSAVRMGSLASTTFRNKYAHKVGDRKETWEETAERQGKCVVSPYFPKLVSKVTKYIREMKFMPGGRYLASAGRKFPAINNCYLFRAQDSRQGWGDLFNKTANSLMTGGGIGVDYSDIREEGVELSQLGGLSSGPIPLAHIVNEQGRYVKQGGSRRSAIWAGLIWNHNDIFKFITSKQQSDLIKQCKNQDFNFPCPLDMTNISVILDDDFFSAYYDIKHKDHYLARDVYWSTVRGMLKDGEPGFSIDIGPNSGESLRNACTEVTSRDDSDMCNLGSINMSRVENIDQFEELVFLGTAFLLSGSLYAKLPMEHMYQVREKNRRIGLGLMGVHEWLLKRGYKYGENAELESWMKVYQKSTRYAKEMCSSILGISESVATRSIAPNGTIALVAETTSSIEPVLAIAYKRRYLDGNVWKAQYCVDATAKRLIDSGVDHNLIEDSLSLAEDVGRRMKFQAWMQEHVDHGISSTINLPPWGSSLNNESTVTRFGDLLLQNLPKLRGITAYPDGSRGGQPFIRCSYEEAVSQAGVEFVDNSETICLSGVCGA